MGDRSLTKQKYGLRAPTHYEADEYNQHEHEHEQKKAFLDVAQLHIGITA